MKLLITGANGFIGKAMLSQLQQHHIFGLVRDAEKSTAPDKVEFISHDFSQRLDSKVLPKKIDAVIHLAQSNQYRNFPEGMADMTSVNIAGLVDILEYARNAQCQQFINFSSGSVYTTDPSAQSEDTPLKPNSAYPLTKYIAEQITDLYSEFFITLNVRLFFPYGPGQQNMLIPNIINSVKNGDVIGLQGDTGGLKLCPIYVDDVVTVVSKCLDNKVDGVMNVGGAESLSLETLANEIAGVVKQKPVFDIDKKSTPAEFKPNLERLQTLLEGQKLTTFSTGIRNTVNA